MKGPFWLFWFFLPGTVLHCTMSTLGKESGSLIAGRPNIGWIGRVGRHLGVQFHNRQRLGIDQVRPYVMNH